jgi:hypothetical protein
MNPPNPTPAEKMAQRYRDISTRLLERYSDLFQNYAWTDEETAIDLMAAEIKTLRFEAAIAKARGTA